MTVLRLLIVAETKVYRDLLASALARVPDLVVTGTSATCAEALERLATDRPDIALVDTGGSEGLRTLQLLGAAEPAVPIVALSVSEHEQEVVSLVEAGIAGYVTRDESIDQLLEIVRRVSRGEAVCSPRIAATLFRRVAQLAATRSAEVAAEMPHLTSREFEIVDLIAEGLSNKEIALRLYIELPTVKNHVHNILRKLRVGRRQDAVAIVRRPLQLED
jgi:two-component system nitrate/nitrite response regulator NarL